MPNSFYLDGLGQKQGPVSPQQLQALAARGVITPNTPLEADTGHKGLAGQIRGLFADVSAPIADTEEDDSAEESKNPINPVPIIVGVGAVLLVLILFAVLSNSGGGTSQSDKRDAEISALSEQFVNAMRKQDAEAMKKAGQDLCRLNLSCFTTEYQVAIQECGRLRVALGDAYGSRRVSDELFNRWRNAENEASAVRERRRK